LRESAESEFDQDSDGKAVIEKAEERNGVNGRPLKTFELALN